MQSAAEESRKLAIHDNYQARGWRIDVTDQGSVDDLVKKTVKEFGRIDYLVNSAGVGSLCLFVVCSHGQLSWSQEENDAYVSIIDSARFQHSHS